MACTVQLNLGLVLESLVDFRILMIQGTESHNSVHIRILRFKTILWALKCETKCVCMSHLGADQLRAVSLQGGQLILPHERGFEYYHASVLATIETGEAQQAKQQRRVLDEAGRQ